MNCQQCFTEIENKIVYCPECGLPYHEECWRKNNSKCTVYGCKGSTVIIEEVDKPENEIEVDIIENKLQDTNSLLISRKSQKTNKTNVLISILVAVIVILLILLFSYKQNTETLSLNNSNQNIRSIDKNIDINESKTLNLNQSSIKTAQETPYSKIASPTTTSENLVYKKSDCSSVIGIINCLLLDIENNSYNTKNSFGMSSLSKSSSENTKTIIEYMQNPSSHDEHKVLSNLAEALLDDFKSAWSEKDFDWYSSFYSKSFSGVTRSNNEYIKKDYSQWISYKQNLFKRYKSIDVNTELINAEMITDKKIKILFSQYFSGIANDPNYSYSDVDKKIIVVKIEDGKLYIIEEKPYK